MTKRDLVVRISSETGLIQEQVLDVVQRTLDHISEALANGETIELRNFGVFEVKVRKARIGRNPNSQPALHLTQQIVDVPLKAGVFLVSRVPLQDLPVDVVAIGAITRREILLKRNSRGDCHNQILE